MNIVIVSQYLRDLEKLKDNNSRFVYLANMLAKKDNNVEIVTSKFLHGSKRKVNFVEQPKNFKITGIEEPGYKKNICLKRFYSHYILARNIYKYLKKINKPDVIYCAIPSLSVANKVSKYCKKNKIKFIIDIQDLWPESFKMVLKLPIISDLMLLPMTIEANRIYASADEIIAVSKTFCERALKVNKKTTKINSVFLGTKLEIFDENKKTSLPYIKNDGDLWLAYCGTLGHSYDLITVFDALDILNKRNIKTPKFIIMGDGPRRKEFENYAKEKNIDCIFTGMLDYPIMCSLLNKCDININPIISASVASIINKHGDYAASGNPVINTQNSTEYRNLIEEYNMGFNCENGNSNEIAECINKLIVNNELLELMGKNARKCAEECFDRKNTYDRILEVIEGK